MFYVTFNGGESVMHRCHWQFANYTEEVQLYWCLLIDAMLLKGILRSGFKTFNHLLKPGILETIVKSTLIYF